MFVQLDSLKSLKVQVKLVAIDKKNLNMWPGLKITVTYTMLFLSLKEKFKFPLTIEWYFLSIITAIRWL